MKQFATCVFLFWALVPIEGQQSASWDRAFSTLDNNGDDILQSEEFVARAQQSASVLDLLNDADLDGSTSLNRNEWNSMLPHLGNSSLGLEKTIAATLQELGLSSSGALFVPPPLTSEQNSRLMAIFSTLDTDGDGVVHRTEVHDQLKLSSRYPNETVLAASAAAIFVLADPDLSEFVMRGEWAQLFTAAGEALVPDQALNDLEWMFGLQFDPPAPDRRPLSSPPPPPAAPSAPYYSSPPSKDIDRPQRIGGVLFPRTYSVDQHSTQRANASPQGFHPSPQGRHLSVAGAAPSLTLVSDQFYKFVNDTVVIIYSAFPVIIAANDFGYYDPHRDLILRAVNITIQGNVKFDARSVFIEAQNLTIIGNATLDVSGATGSPNYQGESRAQDGGGLGQSGQNGAAGGHGSPGGKIQVYTEVISGGTLLLRSAGGNGGMGQDGGWGIIGNTGATGECCCHHDPRGGTGGRGGNAGTAGVSGNGGPAGSVEFASVMPYDWHVQTDVSGGAPGPLATPGQPGKGGHGGPGGGSKCYDAGHWYDHHWRCRDWPRGPDGYEGPAGSPAGPPAPASRGANGVASVSLISARELGNRTDDSYLSILSVSADTMYRNSKFVDATNAYLFLVRLVNGSEPRAAIAVRTSMQLQKLHSGLDFWGNKDNHASLMTWDALYQGLTSTLQMLRDIEASFLAFFDATSQAADQMASIYNSINSNLASIATLESQAQLAFQSANETNDQYIATSLQQSEDQYRATQQTAACNDAIEWEISKEKYELHFKDVFNIAVSVVKLCSGTLTALEDLTKAWSALSDINKALDGFDFVKDIPTIAKNFSTINTGFQDWSKVFEDYKKFQKDMDDDSKKNANKLVMDGDNFDKMIEQYLYLPACYSAQGAFHKFLNTTDTMNQIILAHDTYILEAYNAKAEAKLKEQENDRLESSVVEIFNPLDFMYVQSIGASYRTSKDLVITQLKVLVEASDMQFGTHTTFNVDDSTVASIEAYLLQAQLQHMTLLEQRGVNLQRFNHNTLPMTNPFVFNRTSFPNEFASLEANGTFSFTLDGSHPILAKYSMIGFTTIAVWLPGVLLPEGRRNLVVWIERGPFSLQYDQDGYVSTYTHDTRQFIHDYNVDDLSINGDAVVTDGYASISPMGPWTVSVPAEYNEGVDFSGVNAMYLDLALTGLACSLPVCPPRRVFIAHNQTATETVDITIESTAVVTETAWTYLNHTATKVNPTAVSAEATASWGGITVSAESTVPVGAVAASTTVERNVSFSVTATADASYSVSCTRTVSVPVRPKHHGLLSEWAADDRARGEAVRTARELAAEECLAKARAESERLAQLLASTEARRNATWLVGEEVEFALVVANETATEIALGLAGERSQGQAESKADHKLPSTITRVVVQYTMLALALAVGVAVAVVCHRRHRQNAPKPAESVGLTSGIQENGFSTFQNESMPPQLVGDRVRSQFAAAMDTARSLLSRPDGDNDGDDDEDDGEHKGHSSEADEVPLPVVGVTRPTIVVEAPTELARDTPKQTHAQPVLPDPPAVQSVPTEVQSTPAPAQPTPVTLPTPAQSAMWNQTPVASADDAPEPVPDYADDMP